MRSESVTNKHLHQIAKLKELHTYLINEPYAENKWNPPSYIDENKEITQKKKILINIADRVVSLIGLYVIKNGEIEALSFMQWLGLSPLPENILPQSVSFLKDIKTNILNWPPPISINDPKNSHQITEVSISMS